MHLAFIFLFVRFHRSTNDHYNYSVIRVILGMDLELFCYASYGQLNKNFLTIVNGLAVYHSWLCI